VTGVLRCGTDLDGETSLGPKTAASGLIFHLLRLTVTGVLRCGTDLDGETSLGPKTAASGSGTNNSWHSKENFQSEPSGSTQSVKTLILAVADHRDTTV
jgi:hypothetical protein